MGLTPNVMLQNRSYDGITEAENIAGEQYGEARLLSTLQAVVAAVRSDMHAHIGEQEVFDDITLLLLKQR